MIKSNIRVVFFDLDNTLFDHKKAEQTTLLELLQREPDIFDGVAEKAFLTAYHKHNTSLWQSMARGEIDGGTLKVRRFEATLTDLGVSHPDCQKLASNYLEIYNSHDFALEGASAILDYLSPRYTLGILSNGFADIQRRKLQNLGITSYFQFVVLSGDVGALKPNRLIFDTALAQTGVNVAEIVYIGDSYETDVLGAKQAGWHTIHFNRDHVPIQNNTADAEIHDLLQLKDLL